jgi:hypothetical protein
MIGRSIGFAGFESMGGEIRTTPPLEYQFLNSVQVCGAMIKKAILAMILAGLVRSGQAQLFSPNSMGGALLGGIAGGVIGHNNGGRTAEGAAIGAGAGLLLGALIDNGREDYPVSYGYSERPNYGLSGAVVGGVAGGIIGHNSGGHTAEGIGIGAGVGYLFGSIAERQSYYYNGYYGYAPRYGYARYGYYPRYRYYSYYRPVVYDTSIVSILPEKPAVQPQQPPPAAPPIINNRSDNFGSRLGNVNALFGR